MKRRKVIRSILVLVLIIFFIGFVKTKYLYNQMINRAIYEISDNLTNVISNLNCDNIEVSTNIYSALKLIELTSDKIEYRNLGLTLQDFYKLSKDYLDIDSDYTSLIKHLGDINTDLLNNKGIQNKKNIDELSDLLGKMRG